MDAPTAIYQISLIASFIAGMVALFAPCCISYLLPSYLANVFKERSRVLFMTLIYSLGIFAVMTPIVLGAKFLSSFFFETHNQTYYLGGVFLILVGGLSFLGIKLPMPHFSYTGKQGKVDVLSTFILGIFSGITSACCAPVLIGVVTLSSLTPSLLQSLGVGAFYVAGMVAPLYIASLFIHKRNILAQPIFRKHITTLTIFRKEFPILISNCIAAVVFIITGILIVVLTLNGTLSMSANQDQVRSNINFVALEATEITNKIPGVNIFFLVIFITFIFWMIRLLKKEKNTCCEKEDDHIED